MTAWLDDGDVRLYHGDALERLREMPSESVQCVVTSPPFWGLRDYSCEGQIGLEETPDEWCQRLVTVMREARRVLRRDGVCWIEVGDTYANSGVSGPQRDMLHGGFGAGKALGTRGVQGYSAASGAGAARVIPVGLKPKDLVGAPWLLAFALRADGWYLRSDTIWARPNPMPESVTDRPTKAHSYVFLLTKSARYFYDADSIREPHTREWGGEEGLMGSGRTDWATRAGRNDANRTAAPAFNPAGRNARSVWSIPTEPTPFAHFATFPQALVERCIKSGSAEGDVILDPFVGSGTTCLVARRLGRHAIGIELNPEYLAIAAQRLQQPTLWSDLAPRA